MFGLALGKALLSVGQMGVDIWSAQKQEKTAKELQGRQADFEKEKATHAHQWEMKDLQDAGLNPLLSSKYGGSSVGGISSPMPAPLKSDVASAFQKSTEVDLNKAQKANVEAQIKANSALAHKTEMEAKIREQEAEQEKMATERMRKDQWSKTNPFYENVIAPGKEFLKMFFPFVPGTSKSDSKW